MRAILLITICLLLTTLRGSGQSMNGTDLAARIATKMRDTLQLSDSITAQIDTLSLHINRWKARIIRLYPQADSLHIWMNRVEAVRDSLYQNLLTGPQYRLYMVKKRSLVLNN